MEKVLVKKFGPAVTAKPMLAVVLAGMVTFWKRTVNWVLVAKLIPVMTALSVEFVMFRMDILAPNLPAVVPLTVRVTSTFQRVATAGFENTLDDATQ
jgi:hypothetical protein